MSEPKYDEDLVNLGYLKRVISDTEEGINIDFKNVSRHYGSQPIPPYYEGDTWVDGNIVYTCINTRLVGSYTASDWVTESGALQRADNKSKVFLTQPSNYKPGDMWILQSDNDHRAGKKGEILITTAGRAVYDSDDWVNMLGYGTIRSINEVADNLNNAITRIGVVEEAIEDGIIITFYQSSEPEGVHIGDLWYVTGEVTGYTEGKIYRYNGSTWDLLDDPAIQEAFDEANNARLVADGKIQSFYSASEPTSGDIGVGDLWIDTDDNNKLYRYNGTNWVACYDTRIDDLVETVEETTERVTTIETDLGEIDLTVKETTTRVTTVEGNITNLQAQIDGAIQFWNGSAIPTLSNYPANEWTTEALKNNHRADIYTVIQDVSGELKQGKSYRFDKVGSTWQWVELTDNELSAVQALANSKAKVFITTPTVPYSVGDLWLKDGKLYRCKTAKDANGSYSINDWEEAVEYTDDTAANLAQLAAEAAQGTADGAVTAINNIKDTKGQAEGKYIYLDDSSDDTIISAKFNGETSQATRSGKNILNKDANIIGTNASKIVLDTGVRATCVASGTFRYFSMEIGKSELLGKTLTISATMTPSSNNNGRICLFYGNSSQPVITNAEAILDSSGSVTKTLVSTFPQNCDTVYALIYGNRSGTGNVGDYVDYTNLQIEIGNQATSYEPYGVMPSPDYPSEIINLKGKNLFNKNSVELNKAISATGEVVSSSGSVTSSLIKIEPNTEYRLTHMRGSYYVRTAAFYKYNNEFISYIGISGQEDVNGTITTPDNAYYMRVVSGSNYYENCQVEKGNIPSEIVPFNSLQTKIINKNIFNKNRTQLGSNVTKTVLDTGVRVTTKVAGNARYCGIEIGKDELLGKKVTISANIAVSGTNNASARLFFGKYNTPSTSGIGTALTSTGSNTVTIPNTFYSGTDRIYLLLYSNVNGDTSIDNYVDYTNLQVEIGEEATEYEEYKEQTVYFPLAEGQKLYEGSYLADDGIHNVRGQIVLDGTENWYFTSNCVYTNAIKDLVKKTPNNQVANILCDYYLKDSLANCYNNVNDKRISINNQGYMYIYDTTYTSANSFKTWLLSNPVTVEYELAEEEIIPYNTEQQAAWNSVRELHTYKNITNIYSDAYAEIEYVKDNGLDIYETKHEASRKYIETTEKFAQQKITNESIENTVSQTVTTVANNYNELKTKFDDYAPKSDVITLQTSVNQIMTDTYTKTEINEKLTDGSVTKVSTTAGTFDSNGLTIEKTDAKTKGNFNHEGIKVMDTTSGSNQELLFAGYDEEINETIVRTNNLTVNKYFTLKNVSRQEKYVNPVLGGKGIGTFIL